MKSLPLVPLALLACATTLVACDPAPVPAGSRNPPAKLAAQTQSFYAGAFSRTPSVQAMADLGRRMFFDASLSASGAMSCASCHDPNAAFGPTNNAAVQLGGADGHAPGNRAVPSLRYVQNVPSFTEHHFDESVDESVDQGPTGGHTWDGRADTVHDQARLPLLSPFEMANANPAQVVARAQRASYAASVRETFGDDVFDSGERAFNAVLMALEVFQQSPADFYPYDSKYDAWLRGQTTLTAQESRGLALFNDPDKGNCASCHPSAIQNGNFPQFTDYGFIALGVPRNAAIPANRDTSYFDKGLCGPLRTDLTNRADYCGRFRTPSLRNIALRRVFFHNGVFKTLRDAVEFYAQRDTRPDKYFPAGHDGGVDKFNDLPAMYRENVNMDPPFGGKPGGRPPLSSAEITDVIAFLGTLTDGYRVESSQ